MRARLLVTELLLVVSCLSAAADEYGLEWTHENGFQVGARTALELDWRLARRLHLGYESELRFNNDVGVHKFYNELSADYKFAKWLKAGVSYSFLETQHETKGWRPRHRGSAWITLSHDFGRLTLSLRETFQATHKAYEINTYQAPQTALYLKHRLKASYNIPRFKFDPFISVEVRNTLNAVNPAGFEWGWYTTAKGNRKQWWTNYDPQYNHIYVNRVRTYVGGTWKMDKKNSLDIFGIVEGNFDLDIDCTSTGKLKGNANKYGKPTQDAYLTLSNIWFVGLGLSYRFKL